MLANLDCPDGDFPDASKTTKKSTTTVRLVRHLELDIPFSCQWSCKVIFIQTTRPVILDPMRMSTPCAMVWTARRWWDRDWDDRRVSDACQMVVAAHRHSGRKGR